MLTKDNQTKIFKGSWLISAHAIILILSWIALCIAIPLNHPKNQQKSALLFIAITIVIVFLLINESYYFIIDDEKLSVKNSIATWIKKEYWWNEIE